MIKYTRILLFLTIFFSLNVCFCSCCLQVLENFACFSMTGTFSSDCPPMYLIPSQIPSDDTPYQFRVNMFSLDSAGPSCKHLDAFEASISSVAVRELLPLLPPEIAAARDFNRKIKANVDNTLFLYPFKLEKFKKRYLVEWIGIFFGW